MRAVIVNDGLCYPPSAGNRIRTLNLMVRLARRHDVTYFARADRGRPETRQAVEYLKGQGVQPVIVDHPLPRKSGLGFYARLAANLFSPAPYFVSTLDSPRMRAALAEHAASHAVDVWQFESLTYVDALPESARPRTVMMAHNVEALIWRRYGETVRHPLKRWYLKRQGRKLQRYEGRAFAGVGRVVTVSEEDAALAREMYGVDNVAVVDNGIDRGYFEAVKPRRDPKLILFLGSLDWHPNQDASRLLLDRIFPAVLATEPNARLSIVGRSPPQWLTQRANSTPRVELHADVADVRPHLAGAGVLAVPLRVGGGSRLKILEALACGTPVVSSRVGAEGLRLRPGNHFAEVERAEDMAAALVESIRFPETALEMAERGCLLVREQYDWDVLAMKLERVWEECRADSRAVRGTGRSEQSFGHPCLGQGVGGRP